MQLNFLDDIGWFLPLWLLGCGIVVFFGIVTYFYVTQYKEMLKEYKNRKYNK